MKNIAVIDIGKTNAKLALVDAGTLAEVAVRTTPNTVLKEGLYPHFDLEMIWAFLLSALREFQASHGIDAVSITTHGASLVLLDGEGQLALPMLDYEFDGPDGLSDAYTKVRPPFAETLTPPLPIGLVAGRQVFWQAEMFPEHFARVAHIVTYPQYWAFRLTGTLANEATSLGCHTDLWDIRAGRFSSLVTGQGWSHLFPSVRGATEIVGTVSEGITSATGLLPNTPVYCGIHDSNASLLPHVLTRKPPFAVVSTGTWVIVCAPGGDLSHLDPGRDSFSNVDALGQAVPSARFMGGREYSELTGRKDVDVADADVSHVLATGMMVFPGLVQGSGPFPTAKHGLTYDKEIVTAAQHQAAVSLYLSMMTSECLGLTGASGDIIVEGPFARNRTYLQALAALTGRPVYAQRAGTTGTSTGAALLALKDNLPPLPQVERIEPRFSEETNAYAKNWRRQIR